LYKAGIRHNQQFIYARGVLDVTSTTCFCIEYVYLSPLYTVGFTPLFPALRVSKRLERSIVLPRVGKASRETHHGLITRSNRVDSVTLQRVCRDVNRVCAPCILSGDRSRSQEVSPSKPIPVRYRRPICRRRNKEGQVRNICFAKSSIVQFSWLDRVTKVRLSLSGTTTQQQVQVAY